MMTEEQIREVLLRKRLKVGGRALASSIGVSEAHISQVISGKNPPGPKVLALLGMEKKVMYVRKDTTDDI